MVFLGILMLLGIVCIIELIQNRVDDSYAKDIEKKHKNLVDMYQGNPLVVRELKARVETMIHSGMKEYQNIEYKPNSGILCVIITSADAAIHSCKSAIT